MDTNPLMQFMPQNGTNNNAPNVPSSNNPLLQFMPNNQTPSQTDSDMNKAINSLSSLPKAGASHGDRLQAIDQTGDSLGASTMAFIDTFNKQMGDLPRGIIQLLGYGDVKSDGGISSNEQEAMSNRDAQTARQQHPVAAFLGDATGLTGNMIASQALGEGALGVLGSVAPKTASVLRSIGSSTANYTGNPMLGKMAQGALDTFAWSGAQATTGDQTHLGNALKGFGIGAAVPLVTHIASEALGPAMGYLNKVLNPKGAAANEIADNLEKLGVGPSQLSESAAPANNIGANLSVGESLGNDSYAKIESKLGAGDVNSMAAAQQHINDLKATIGDSIQKISDGLVPEGNPVEAKQLVDQGFDSLKNTNIPEEQLQAIQNNPVLKQYLDSMNESKMLPQNLQGLPDTNAFKLSNINQQINDDLYKNVSSVTQDATKNLTNNDRIALQEAKGTLQDTLDKSLPGNAQYSNLMDLTSRNIQRNQLMQNLQDAIKGPRNLNPDGTTETDLQSLYNKLWNTPEKQQAFTSMVANSGQDPQVAKDVIYTLNHAINSPIQKIVNSGLKESVGRSSDNEALGMLKEAIGNLTTNNYKSELLKLTLGGAPQQSAIIKAMTNESLSNKIMALPGILSAIKSAPNVISAAARGQIPAGYLNPSNLMHIGQSQQQ